jgi:prepilin-type N-terminal cleavage/methylation domain-containing protein
LEEPVKPATAERGITLIEMLIVVSIISLMAGLTYPAVTAGIDSVRMRSAADATAGFLNQAMTACERRQQAVEIQVKKNTGSLSFRTVDETLVKRIDLPDGIFVADVLPAPLASPDERSILLYPGATFPRLTFVLATRKGARRLIRIDPVVGMPVVEVPQTALEETPQDASVKSIR